MFNPNNRLKLLQLNKYVIFNITLLLVVIVSVVSPVPTQAQQLSADHLSVFFVIDDSGSMKTNDPNNLRVTAVKLFITMLDPGDGAAVITFADDSEVRVPFTRITGYDDKVNLINAVGEVKSDGFTNMKAAFEDVLDVIKEDQTGNRKIVIFLTDGKPELPAGVPANYESETLELIRQAKTPVLAIGLTAGGLTSFLGQVPEVAGEGSLIIPAKTANDLLDVYLGILGQLKDRTIMGEGTLRLPATADLAIDPSLVEYIDNASFIAVLPPNGKITLVTPDGSELTNNDSIFTEVFAGIDPNFTVFTLPNPVGGNWQLKFEGNGVGQARAILRSRLRVKVLEPGYFAPAGEPLPIMANLIAEDTPNPPIKSVGDATFSVLIEGPGDLRESLDLLYDDGTHGDKRAGDGDFTNLFVNTDTPGTYTITVTGRKGVVPVSTRTQVEVIEFPEIVIDAPSEQRYEIRTNTIPLQIHLNEANSESRYEGEFKAVILSPGGDINEITLENSDNGFSGEYTPLEDGIYRVSFEPVIGYYQGQPYHYTADVSFEAAIVANLIVQDAVVGLGDSAGSQKFEVAEARQGIPVVVTVESKSDQPQAIEARLEQMPGFSLMEKEPFIVAPLGETTLTVHLIGDEQIGLGSWQGKLALTPTGLVDILNNQQALDLEIYQPSLTLTPQIISMVSAESCLNWAPIRVLLQVNSTSVKSEKISLLLQDIPGAKLSQESIDVPPGQTQVEVMVLPDDKFTPGEYQGQIMLSGRDGLVLLPDSQQNIAFTVDPVWVTCQRPLIILGAGILLFGIVLAGVIVKRVKRNQPAIVTGTLIYWLQDASGDEMTMDLTALKKTEVTLGKGTECTIPLLGDDTLSDIHARIKPEKFDGEEPRLVLEPVGPMQIGYRQIKRSVQLEQGIEYQLGNYAFRYTPDPQ